MCQWIKSIHNGLRNLVMTLDYGLYVVISLFKYKPFPTQIKRILVVELLKIGDLLVITPALRALKETFKSATIDVLIAPEMNEILKGNKNINKILTDERSFSKLVEKIRRAQYDLGVLFHPGSFRMSLALLKGKIKYRVGCTTDVGILSGKGFFLNKKVKPRFVRQHKRDDSLAVVNSIKATTRNKDLEIYTTKKAERKVDAWLKRNNLNKSDNVVIIHAGSKHKKQRWIHERWAHLIESVSTEKNTKVIMTGTTEDQRIVQEILSQTKAPVVNAVGKTTFKEYVALIKRADLVITVDTSTTHIASALKKPVIVLFGPTYPERWGPTGTKAVVIMNKEKTMGSITEEQVLRAYAQLQ